MKRRVYVGIVLICLGVLVSISVAMTREKANSVCGIVDELGILKVEDCAELNDCGIDNVVIKGAGVDYDSETERNKFIAQCGYDGMSVFYFDTFGAEEGALYVVSAKGTLRTNSTTTKRFVESVTSDTKNAFTSVVNEYRFYQLGEEVAIVLKFISVGCALAVGVLIVVLALSDVGQKMRRAV